ncbi:MAG: hypothetical protein ACKOOL_13520 [Novosphingobium sp.]
MRLLIALAAFALAPSAALAADGNSFDGHLSASAGYNSHTLDDWTQTDPNGTNSGTDGTKVSGADFEIHGSVSLPIAGSIGAQVDGALTRTNYTVQDCQFCNKFHSDNSTAALHLFTRGPKVAFGVFGQRTTQSMSWNESHTLYAAGGEARVFAGPVHVSGQFGYVGVESGNYDAKIRGPHVAANLRFFPQPNLKFELRGSHTAIKQSPNDNSGYNCPDYCYVQKLNNWNFGTTAEYRLPHSGLSFFARVDVEKGKQRSEYDNAPYFSDYEQKFSRTRAMFGIKFSFGSSSLVESDRSGAGFDPVQFDEFALANNNNS